MNINLATYSIGALQRLARCGIAAIKQLDLGLDCAPIDVISAVMTLQSAQGRAKEDRKYMEQLERMALKAATQDTHDALLAACEAALEDLCGECVKRCWDDPECHKCRHGRLGAQYRAAIKKVHGVKEERDV